MKKLFSILSLIVLALASSVIFISCGDDYKNMYLEVQYAEWSNTEGGGRVGEWKTIDLDKGLDFVLSESNKRADSNYYDLRMRVLVKGTKKKIDFVSVSCTGSSSLQLDVSTVKDGEEFVVKVYTTGSANMFFTPSVKSDKKAVNFPINLYDEIATIEQNDSYFPSVVKGGELNLNNLTDLIIYNGRNGWTTNQLGVAYSIDGVESVDGVYTFADNENHEATLDTRSNANILKVPQNFSGSNIKLTATSVYSGKTTTQEEIACQVEVKVVDNIDNSQFLVNYASRFDREFSNNNGAKITTLNLYPNNTGYDSTNLVLSGLFDSSTYSFEKFENVQFETRVFVDGVDVTDRADAYHGLKISRNTSMESANGVELSEKLNQVFLVESTTYLNQNTNVLKFVVGVKNLRFTSPVKNYNLDSSILTYTINVVRENLPKSVTINDNPYTDGSTFSQYIYSDYGNLNGLNLTVNTATSTQKTTEIKITAYTNPATKTYDSSVRALSFYSYNGSVLGGSNAVVTLNDARNSIYAKFVSGSNSYPKQVYVDFEVLSSPSKFDGVDVVGNKKYITVTMTLNTIGKISSVSSTNDEGNYDLFNASISRLLEASKGIKSNLNLSSGSDVLVNYSTAVLRSQNGNIKFSSDNVNFVSELNCKELTNKVWYFKAENNQTDQIILQTDLGQVWKSSTLNFVTTTTMSSPTIKLTTKNSNLVKLGSKSNYEGENTGSADFYAMQFNTTADFYAGYGTNFSEYRGITGLTITALPSKENITSYGVDVFAIQKFDNGYSFNLNAKRTDLTSALKVNVTYYTGSEYAIEQKTQTMYLEIASYRPITNLQLVASNKEIYYVNQLITDKATTEIVATFDDNATKSLSFSDITINEKVNSSLYSNKQSLYYVEVRNEVAQNVTNEIEQTGLINEQYLDLTTSKYSMKLTKNLDNLTNILVQFRVTSYALNISKTFSINIAITNFVKAEDIEIKGTAQNNNIYMSLQYEDKKSASFEARVSNVNATYKFLDYQLYKFDENNASNNYIGDRVVSNDVLSVAYDEELKKFNLQATGTNGGKFVLRIVSLDSYNNFTKDYDLYKYVVITISDGSESNPFYLYNSTDIENIATGLDKHYIIANNIDLSEVNTGISGTFTGSINGIIASYNASTGIAVSYAQSYLSNLNIANNTVNGAQTSCLYLFEENAGTIKNIVMRNVKFNLNVTGFQSNAEANIGALVGKNTGKIINCSAIVTTEGTININRTNESTSAMEYNIGALIGKNEGEVYFYDENNDDLKMFTDIRQMAIFDKKLTVTLNSVGSDTQVNVGGSIGKNTNLFVGNYYDFNQNEAEYLTVKSDIDLQVSSASENFSAAYSANIGGFVGYNAGQISQVAIKGSITGAGNNLNVGGIAGQSTNVVIDGESVNALENCATFSCNVEGRPFEQGGNTQSEIENQSIGGAVGQNSGNIYNTYILFISNTTDSTQFGIVKGVDVVGGLIGRMTGGAIVVGNVQSFVDDYCVVGKFGNNGSVKATKSVAGLVGCLTDGTISKSYAKVNISADGGNVATLVNGVDINNSFYIGSVLNNVDSNDLFVDNNKDLTINSNANTYSLVKNYALTNESGLVVDVYGKLFYNGEAKAYYYYDQEQDKELWTTTEPTFDADAGNIYLDNSVEASDFDLFTTVGWTIDDNWTNDYKQYNSGLPVIVDDDNPTLLALAESLIARVDDKIFDYNKNVDNETLKVYTSEYGIFFAKGITNGTEFSVTESTAIVFLNNTTFNLVSKNNNAGLVNLEVLPNIASSSYRVNIISGSDKASIVGNFITFRRAGRVEIEFVSTFNPNAKDRVVIFAVEPIDDFEIQSENLVGNNLSMYTNSTALVSLLTQYMGKTSTITDDYLYLNYAVYKKATEYTAGQDYYKYDSGKKSFTKETFDKTTFDEEKNNIYLKENLDATNSGLKVLPLGRQLEIDGKKYYSFADIQLKLNDFDGNDKQYKLAIDCYLDLSKFVYTLAGAGVDEQTLRDLFNVQYKVSSNDIDLTLCQKAQSITSSITDTKVATSQSVQFDIEVISGYIDKDDSKSEFATNKFDGQLLKLDIGNKESVVASLSTDADFVAKYNLATIWDLFNINVSYVLNSNQNGYIFTYTFELKDEYKAILDDVEFVFTFCPATNDSITKQVKVTFEPQSITTLRMENYKSGVATLVAGSNNIVEYTSSEVQSSIIVPGKSGLVKIFVEPTFARVDELVISSSSITVDGRTYTVKFQQMLYDQSKGHYVSYMGYTAGSDSLQLVKNSYIDTNGNLHYTGVVYVRTVLENAVALKETFTLTVTAKEYERENGAILDTVKTEKVATKMLLTQFNPGLYVTSNGAEAKTGVDSVYLVEKSSNRYKIFATIKGYEINQNPQLTFEALDDKTSIGDSIKYIQSAVVPQTNGDYVVTWDLQLNELNVPVKFTVTISLITEDMLLENKKETITVYPVDYIPTSVSLRGTANDVLRVGVNSQKDLDLIWKSGDTELNSDEITALLGTCVVDGKSIQNYLQYFYLTSYNSLGQTKEENWQIGKYKSNGNDIYELGYNDTTQKYFVKALGESYLVVNFGVKYEFIYNESAKKFEIKFYTHNDTGHSGRILNFSFRLDMRVETSEEEPDPIYTVEDLMNMTDGGNYILMNNLTLTDWVPLTAQIASLDGNNKVLKIKNFQVATNGEIYAGLFATIGENCIIKNLTIDVSEFTVDMDTDGNYLVMLADENAEITNTYFGFIAGQNNGLIYNSELINIGGHEIKINIKTSSAYSYIGGLVGQNNGNITNSRVGTPYFLPLNINSNGIVSEGTPANTSTITLKSSGIVGGFAGVNNGIISSSYFQNANLVNYSTVPDDTTDKTGGFVAVNTGSIFNSYSKGKGRNSTTARGSETSISATHAGSASGFVFENSGLIENCYSNIFVQSSSSAVAGFVYRNTATGKIYRSYSAGKVSSNNTNNALATELPFVGVGIDGTEVNKLLSYGELNNCFYLELTGDNFDDNFEYDEDMDLPIGLDDTNFADSENLLNFAFIDGNYEQAIRGVWTYYSNLDSKDTTTSNLGKTFLPELTSANQISRSIRYIVSTQDDRNHFAYGSSYELGSKNNPYIIRNYNEYNSVFSISTLAKDNVIAGSIRLINNIDFVIDSSAGTTATVNTTNGYDLGDKLNSTMTVFDGNGMTISGVDIKNYETQELSSLGLFSNIYNAVIKSLNVEYVAMDYTSTQATYSGGLAGTITDSSIIDVNISGTGTTITARNFGGGVAGLVTGKSMLYNVSSNINVKVTYATLGEAQQYVSKDDFNTMYAKLGYTSPNDYNSFVRQLSYAGGIAGVIDVVSNKANFTNINKLVVGESGSTNVTADIAGFVAGYLGRNVSAKRLKSYMSGSSYVFGAYIAGGLVGENYATIAYSQVSALQTTQESVDTAFANYILSDRNTPTSTPIGDNAQFGNLHFVRGESIDENIGNVAGGFIGVNYNASISNSYSKASIDANARYIGGFVGVSIGGGYETCYNQNYFDILNKDRQKYIGGFIGYNRALTTNGITKVASSIIKSDSCKVDNIVVASFYDKSQLEVYVNNYNANTSSHLDYVITLSDNSVSSAQGIGTKSIYTFYLSYGEMAEASYYKKAIKRDTQDGGNDNYDLQAETKAINRLYDLTDEKQLETYTSLFTNFNAEIWKKDHKIYTPYLLENPSLNYYIIRNEADLNLINLHPNGNFEVEGDIALSSARKDYVINAEFTGTIRGKLNVNGNVPKISGIKINTENNVSAGFFKKTTGAKISNLQFVYDYMYIEHSKDYVGLLSADESYSEVTGVNISIKTDADVNNGNNIKVDVPNIATANSIAIKQFGGLFGNSKSTVCTSCTVNLGNKLSLTGSGEASSFGGFAGSALGESTLNVDSMFMNCQLSMPTVENGLQLKNFRYVGGAIGYAQNVNINTINVSAGDKPIKIVNTGNSFVGGLVGYQLNSYISNSKAIVELMDKKEGETKTIKFGGISGYVQNDGVDKSTDIVNTSAKLVLTAEMNNATVVENINIVSVGGLVGATKSNVKLDDVVAWTSGMLVENTIYYGGLIGETDNNLIVINNAYSYNGGNNYKNGSYDKNEGGVVIKANNITAGGLLGLVSSNNATVSIDNSFVNGAVFTKSKDAGETKMLHLGGLIGAWFKQNADKDIATDYATSVELPNGDIYTTHINNVYTTFGLEYSQFKLNNGSVLTLVNSNWATDYCVGGIIGRVSLADSVNNSKLSLTGFVYSSDYVLAVEEKDIFTSTPVNVTAEVLLKDRAKEKYFSTDNGWNIEGFNLPYRQSLASKMEGLKDNNTLLARFSSVGEGSAVKPKVLDPNEGNNYTFADSDYKYYFVDSGVSSYIDSTQKINSNVTPLNLFGALKGFLLGNGKTILVDTTDSSNNMTMAESSVVSNLNVQLKYLNKMSNSGSHGVIADTNNGTIFNCQVDLYYIGGEGSSGNAYGGAIAGENKGNILYCYSTGTIENAGTINYGGIAKTNYGFIYTCGSVGLATGSVSGNGIAGIACDNQGTIYNSFSAMSGAQGNSGDVPSTIFNSNSGYAERCYYDQYANDEIADVKDSDGKNTLVTHLSTRAMQTNYQDKLIGNWTNYMMRQITKDDDGNIIGEKQCDYFNYGYPVYVIEQFWFDNTDATNPNLIITEKGKISKKGIFTGNGTENSPYLIINKGTLESINDFGSTSGKYFALINDITFTPDGKNGLSSSWNGLGGNSQENAGWFKNSTTGAFKGNFVSSERFDADWIRYDKTPTGETGASKVRKITNLNGSPFFTTIASGSGDYPTVVAGLNFSTNNESCDTGSSVFAGEITGGNISISAISFAGTFTLTASGGNAGLLTGIIATSTDETGSTSMGIAISSISVKDVTCTANAEVFGIIVGQQESNEVRYNSIEIAEGEYGYKNDSSSVTTLGGILGQLTNNGKSVFAGCKINGLTLGAKNNVGSVIGVMTSGSVQLLDNEIGTTANKLAIFNNTGNMGGYVGSMISGNFSISKSKGSGSADSSFELGTKIGDKDRVASNVGGVIGNVKDGTISGNGATVSIATIRALNNAGGLIGLLEKGKVYGFNVKFESASENENYAQCFGGFVGNVQDGMIGGLGEGQDGEINISADDQKMTISGDIKIGKATQIGGLAGVVVKGSFINIEMTINSITSKSESATGSDESSSGMGGLVGVVGNVGAETGNQLASTITLAGIESSGDLSISSDGSISNVGGFFGLLRTNVVKTSIDDGNNEEITIASLKVSGVRNVGGFAGQYAFNSMLTIGESLTDYLGESGDGASGEEAQYATILLPEVAEGEQLNITGEVGNFGGLFGYYNSSAQMGYTIDGQQATEEGNADGEQTLDVKPFVNNNPVLYYGGTDSENLPVALSLGQNTEKVVKNIGGVAGYARSETISGTNKANVGSLGKDEPNDMKMEDLKGNDFRNKTINSQNVGGIVGSNDSTVNVKFIAVSNSGEIRGYENVGGIIGSLSANDNVKVSFDGKIESNKNVIGITNIGGLIGYSCANYTIMYQKGSGQNADDTVINIAGKVTGRTSVGGVVGVMKKAKDESEELVVIGDITVNTTTTGLINVGGIVGAIDDVPVELRNTSATGQNSSSKAKYTLNVVGNTNVGGLVGNALEKDYVLKIDNFESAMVTSIKITPKEYNYGKIDDPDNKGKKKDVYYMSTSVGGFVGNANNIYLRNINIDSSKTLNVETSTTVKKQASSVSNYIVANGNTLDVFVYKEEKNVKEDDKSFDNMTTGIGGLIGTLSGYRSDEYGEVFVDLNNLTSNFDVLVENGINVGGLIGYFAYQPNVLNSINSVSVGTDDDTERVWIVGALGVGGMFGKITNSTNAPIAAYSTDGSGKMKTLQVEFGYVNIQTKPVEINGKKQAGEAVHAEYVGTFAGVSDSIYSIEVTGNINLNNNKGGYYGGIVGKLNGSLGSMSQNAGETDVADSSVNVVGKLFSNEKVFNYGGLVGLADATENDIVVLGSHKYEFTIDSLRTTATTGDVNTSIDHDNKQILLMANKTTKYDAIISETKKYTESEDNYYKNNSVPNLPNYWNTLSNPILDLAEGKTTGWSKEYTMFRTMELCECGSVNGQTVFTTIYDASNITEVYSNYSLNDDKILYTIYENEGNPILYSRLGIATFFVDTTKSSRWIGYTDKENFGSYRKRLIETQFLDKYGIDKDTFGSLYFNNHIYNDGTPIVNDIIPSRLTSTNSFNNFRSENAFKNILASNNENKRELFNQLRLDYFYIKGAKNGIYTTCYFKFGLVFADPGDSSRTYKLTNNTDASGEETTGWTVDPLDPERTFSLFDIQSQLNNKIDKVNDIETTIEKIREFFKTVGVTLVVAIAVISAVYTGGTSLTVAGAIFLSLGIVAMGTLIVNAIHLIAGLFTPQYQQKYIAINYMTTDYTGVYGFLTPPIAQPWYFKEGKLVCETDEMIVVAIDTQDGTMPTADTNDNNRKDAIYVYSSTSRPAGYGQIITLDNTKLGSADSLDIGGKNQLAVGDKLPQFVYRNGKYYISIFGLQISKRYIVNQGENTISWDASANWWRQDEQGLYYVGEDVKDLMDNMGLDSSNIKDTKTYQNKIQTLYFGKKTNSVTQENPIENYDYVNVTMEDLYSWHLVPYSQVNPDKDVYVEVYQRYYYNSQGTKLIWLYEVEPDSITTIEYWDEYAQQKVATSVFNERMAIKAAPSGKSIEQLIADIKVDGIRDPYDNNHEIRALNGDIINWENKWNEVKDNNLILLPCSENNFLIKRNRYFYYYDTGLKNGYSAPPVESGKPYPMKLVNTNSMLYKEDGALTPLKDIKSQADLNNYYISMDNFSGDDKEKAKYKATAFYYIEGNGDNAKYYMYDTSYICENIGTDSNPIYVMAKVGIVDDNANYLENKFMFKFNGSTIYTRYQFLNGNRKFTDVLKNNGLLPSSNQNGWITGQETNGGMTIDGTDYYFTEIILFSGNSYNSSESSKSKCIRSYSSAKNTKKYEV